MTDTFVLIGSITYAMKARKIVKEQGIDAQIVKHDTKGRKGCSYGLICKAENTIAIIGILRANNIPYEVTSKKQNDLS